VGINLFPDRKVCSFDCPYCEVFPFQTDLRFSLPVMEEALGGVLAEASDRGFPVRDLCFWGNGEPTLSRDFPAALEAAGRLRERLAPAAALVVITNGTGLRDEKTFACMRDAARGEAAFGGLLDIWLKLDAGTPEWYEEINRSTVPFEELTACIRRFIRAAPATLQTMVCAVRGGEPPAEEEAAWVRLAAELAAQQPGVRKVQIYGKVRPAPEDPLAEALPEALLEKRAEALRAAAGLSVPVAVFP
jgi:histidinol dehydrogenase